MPSYTCYPPTEKGVLWPYCPSFGAAVTFSCLFGVVSIAHIVQAIIHKKPFSWILIMGCLWECGGYIFRSLAVTAQKHIGWLTAQSLLILLAPLWINAFVYMLLGRMVQFFLDERRVCRVKAKHFTWIFVSLDILSFIVQGAGGIMTNQQDMPQVQKDGLNVYMGGLGIQQLFIIIFTYLAIRFQKKLALQEQRNLGAGQGVSMTEFRSPHQARKLLKTVYLVLGLITLRIIFRLIEFSQGTDSYLNTHEWFPYVFDAVPMLAATIVFHVVHPGSILRGPNSDFTEEKKAAKEKKEEKKQVKKEAKREKKEMSATMREV
jgi:RTA1 like protein